MSMALSEVKMAVAVAAGGAVGALARYGVARAATSLGATWPAGTFIANVSGSFLMGVLVGSLLSRPEANFARAFLAVGFLGAFTTFSTFSLDVVNLIRDRSMMAGGVYALGSLIAGVLALIAGVWAGHALMPGGRS
ncbi:MAG: CrcB family protein [Pseudomonadota bacterium]